MEPDLDAATLTESELIAAIQAAKDKRDELPYGDPLWYEAQYEVYRLNEALLYMRRAKRRN